MRDRYNGLPNHPEDIRQGFSEGTAADDYLDSCADVCAHWTVEAAALYAQSLKAMGWSNEAIASQLKKDCGLTVRVVESPMQPGFMFKHQAS